MTHNQQTQNPFDSGRSELMKSYIWGLSGFVLMPTGFGLIAGPMGMVNARKATALGKKAVTSKLLAGLNMGMSLLGMYVLSFVFMSVIFENESAVMMIPALFTPAVGLVAMTKFVKKNSPNRPVRTVTPYGCNHQAQGYETPPRYMPAPNYESARPVPMLPVQDVVRNNTSSNAVAQEARSYPYTANRVQPPK